MSRTGHALFSAMRPTEKRLSRILGKACESNWSAESKPPHSPQRQRQSTLRERATQAEMDDISASVSAGAICESFTRIAST